MMQAECRDDDESVDGSVRECGTPGCCLPDHHCGLCETEMRSGKRQRSPASVALRDSSFICSLVIGTRYIFACWGLNSPNNRSSLFNFLTTAKLGVLNIGTALVTSLKFYF